MDNYNELECCIGVVTETWLKDGQKLEEQLENIRGAQGLRVLYKNRKGNHRGVAHGGCVLSPETVELRQRSCVCITRQILKSWVPFVKSKAI